MACLNYELGVGSMHSMSQDASRHSQYYFWGFICWQFQWRDQRNHWVSTL